MLVTKSRIRNSLFLSPTPGLLRLRSRPTRAFSLLEVSVALAIFVFGAIAVMRLFPGVLRTITYGGDRQNAMGLNRTTLARVQADPPLATYDTQDGSNWKWQDGVAVNGAYEPRAVLGSGRSCYSLPRTNEADFERSALGSLRAIIGENETVQQEEDGKFFVLTQFPIFGNSVQPTQVRVWKRVALEGVKISDTGALDLSSARLASTGEHFTPPGSAVYYITFRYHDNNSLWGVTDAPTTSSRPVVVPDTAPAEAGAGAAARVIAGTVNAVCAHLLGTVSASDEGDNKRGIVDLEKLGVKTGEQVSLDYQADWSWIMQTGIPDTIPEERPAGANKPRQIALGAPYIEDRTVNSVYTLCQTRKNGKPDFFESSWGQNQTLNGSQKLYAPTDSDLRAGRLTFETGNLGTDESFVGTRIAFRTRDGWAQQMSVAASSYKPYGCGPSKPSYLEAGEPWRDYVLDMPSGTLYFHSSEAGKSVLVTYSYSDGGQQTTLRDRLLTIDDQPTQSAILPAGFAPSGYVAPLQLTDINGDILAPNALVSISGVRGASLSMRTAWQDGSHYTQSFLTAMRLGAGAEAMP